MEIPKGFGTFDIQPGLYSVFTIKGSCNELNQIYRHIYLDWFPYCKYRLKSQMTFEIYSDTPDKANANNLITEIYIPIEAK